jgi:hypothetical protein
MAPAFGSTRAGTDAPGGAVAPIKGATFSLTIALGVAVGLVVLRSLVFLLFEQSFFDGDQAVFGIMALHLAKARAFPLYMYGQGYLLAVSVWLAAPFVAALGPTVLALKLPLLLLNVLVAGLLLRGLVRDCGLSPAEASLAALPFTLAPVVPASRLVEHQGAIIEPFVWILLLWVLRRRPLLLGLVAGIGYLNRPFTAYGLVALAVVAVVEAPRPPRWPSPRRLRAGATFVAFSAAAFAGVLAVAAALQPLSTYPSRWVPEIGFKGWPSVAARLSALFEAMLPGLAGGSPASLFGIHSQCATGSGWAPPLLLAACGLALLAGLAGTRGVERRRVLFPLFLILASATALITYVAIGIGWGDPSYLRYVVLGLLLPTGLLALALVTRPHRATRGALALGMLLWAGLSAVDHGRLVLEYLRSTPPDDIRQLVAFLEGRGIEVGLADYPTANIVSYLSGERVRLAAQGVSRVREYRALLRERRDVGVGIVFSAGCHDGTRVARWCVVDPPAPLHLREAMARAGP